MESNTMSDNEFQYLREKLQKEVKQYIELDDKIRALNVATRDLTKTRTKLSESILLSMKQFEINDMNIKSGKLSYNEKTKKKPLNKKNLLSGLTLYFDKDVDTAMNCSKVVLDNREDVTKVLLKRVINKKK